MSEISKSALSLSEIAKAADVLAKEILTSNPSPEGVEAYKAAVLQLKEEGKPAVIGIKHLSRKEAIDAVEKILDGIKRGIYRI
ncbi:hypothetical protein [Carnimonas bestiolae]|uniref:hypothetical protein n=1 Tax=Carnimonas bestiolae TaxID=3402172 RepID=UPI003EDBFE99